MKLAITATYRYDFRIPAHYTDQPQGYTVSAVVADEAEAARIVALFPKSAGLRATGITGSPKGTGYITGRAKLWEDKVNGGKNEAGIKRYRSVVKTAAKLGIEIDWNGGNCYVNSYDTREAFEAVL